ncbi:DUF2927 domain-containing protein [Falsirhodobacter deserti]|uniref:DUF2927 domain-containing protein n=1 Tax=Falsirhodobacter deserti TaxID=1365611 RepID=UPI000FE30D37|nr:DUF2927 domain-containing protein [Falsirhodobacter deserti]
MRSRVLKAAVLLVLLSACADPAPQPRAPDPDRPRARPEPAAPMPPSPQSVALRDYYAKVQANLLSRGLLRTDGGSSDTPWDDRILAENFIRIAFYDEYRRGTDGFEQAETPTPMRRWAQPIRVGLVFGPSVDARKKALERARIGSYIGRIQRLTGHPLSLVSGEGNFNIFIVNEDERRSMGKEIARAAPSLSAAELDAVRDLPRDTYCLVYASSAPDSTYTRAFALIREEHPALLGLACLHEEIAQAMGLQNDSPRARPSVFNDDEEFALLTGMDEQMLRMLYDPRLRPGMTEDEARPLVQTIAAQLVAGGAS